MKTIVLALLCLASTAFADQFVLDNQTTYPAPNKKIAIEWASSAQEVDASNKALLYNGSVQSKFLVILNQQGKIDLTIPPKATYFRVIAWSTEKSNPDHSTNWIEVVPGKTYTLHTDQLVPVVLMSGMGC